MKPHRFSYCRPESVAQAVAALAALGDDAKVLAGGQSLMPLLNLRLAGPRVLVDVSSMAELRGIEIGDEYVTIGAATTHQEILDSGRQGSGIMPLLGESASLIGHWPIRTRGTIGGSLAHADPAAEWCTLALALDARIRMVGQSGPRLVGADEMFLGPFTSALADTELLTAVDFPAHIVGYGVREFTIRRGDFATVVVAVAIRHDRDANPVVRIAAGGIDTRAIRIREGEDHLSAALREPRSTSPDQLARDVAAACAGAVHPLADNHASSDYRRHLVGELVAQAATDAIRMGDEVA